MQGDVVGDDECSWLELAAGEPEELVVEAVGRIEEDEVEHVVDRRQCLTRVTFDEVGPVLKPRIRDVAAPVRDATRFPFERENSSAEMTHRRREPDRRVAPSGADLQDFAVGLRRTDREQKLSGRPLDRDAR